MKALITGGTGFVGSHIARVLVEAGHQVRVLHRASSRLDALVGIPFESALGDVTEPAALDAACAGCDWVFHVAAVADYWRADVKRMFAVNIDGTRLVLEAAQRAGVKRVIFTSSAASVGFRSNDQPADESTQFNFPPAQFPYGYSKLLAERVMLEALDRGQDVVTVNPVVIMGPGDLNVISGGFVLNIKRLSWAVPVTAGGVAVTDVRDVARWHLAAAERGITGERYILGTENIPYPLWFALIADEVGAARPGLPLPSAILPALALLIDWARGRGINLPVDGNQTRLGGKNIFFDFSKAWTALGEPQIDMRQSVRETYRWYAEHGYVQPDAVSRLLDWVAKKLF